jgi:hypothetical protein
VVVLEIADRGRMSVKLPLPVRDRLVKLLTVTLPSALP